MTAETVFEGRILVNDRTTLGEGPGYDPNSDQIWWFDILNSKLHLLNASSRDRRIVSLPEMASAMAVVDERRHVIAMETGLYFHDVSTGALSLHAAIEPDNAVTRSNDARVHQSGAFWVSTMGKEAEDQAGAIYHVLAGKVTKIFDKVSIPNAICFSPDGATGYFVDSRINKLMRVPVDAETGLPEGPEEVFIDTSKMPGAMDGAICDGDGHIWNARFGAGVLDHYDTSGKLVARFQLPARQPTCPAFIGRDGGWMMVTSASRDADIIEEPNAGFTFALVTGANPRFDPAYRAF
ncbi:SMP-30/gluconolactonase/LRE family protein [Martelella lutilitoris]|uniref:SMP-30/gluconolactonase/LRE family protein n=1 Tax=Martelella lutilitoris TaxID=2583532 RepID=A0A7T7HIR8_9HYPH|nr:SMP-30/gluconolactonase/LRE family protein [Martelella lutilitoris]QQM29921.1 SMP-30/gluconolactonase/LRE family protein [Martelella lutilitoris]